jgi:hypothetical protein
MFQMIKMKHTSTHCCPGDLFHSGPGLQCGRCMQANYIEYSHIVNGRKFLRTAWTGGDTPPKGFNDPYFKGLRKQFFRELLKDCGGLDLWECAGTTRWERARIFWNQATLNAWRTLKEYERKRT